MPSSRPHSEKSPNSDWYRPNDFSAAIRTSRNARKNHEGSAVDAGTLLPDQELYLRQRAALQAQILGNRMRL